MRIHFHFNVDLASWLSRGKVLWGADSCCEERSKHVAKTRVEKEYFSPHGRKAHTTKKCRSLARMKDHVMTEFDVCRLCWYEHGKDR